MRQTAPETTGKIPIAVAAAAIYVAAMRTGEKITEKELGVAAGVTEACVRNSVKAFNLQQARTMSHVEFPIMKGRED